MSIELARKRAKKFFQYHKLSLPVKIDELLKHYAGERFKFCVNRKN